MFSLIDFVMESWRIEGLVLNPLAAADLASYHAKWMSGRLSVTTLSEAASLFTDGYGRLRDKPGMDVRVGHHIPLRGGPAVHAALKDLCEVAINIDAYDLHCRFEHIHPFMDGNGRTGRLLWLWRMEIADLDWSLGFLHTFYYQTLSVRRPTPTRTPNQ